MEAQGCVEGEVGRERKEGKIVRKKAPPYKA
jgi:hypothetical protein